MDNDKKIENLNNLTTLYKFEDKKKTFYAYYQEGHSQHEEGEIVRLGEDSLNKMNENNTEKVRSGEYKIKGMHYIINTENDSSTILQKNIILKRMNFKEFRKSLLAKL